MNRRSLIGAMLLAGTLLAAPAKAADRLTVLLEWFVNPDHAPLVVAQRLGLFEQFGLEVELIPPSDPSSVPRLVAAGQADIGIHYQPNLYLDRAAGVPIVRFGTLVETPLNSLTVLAGGPVKSIADLKGKAIGYSVSAFETVLLRQMLATASLKPEDVTLINVNFALSASLASGRVDATIGGFRNFEQTQMRLEGHEVKAFLPEDYGVPAYDELIFITRAERANDARLPRFLQAVEKAALYLTNHPDEAWKLFIAAYPALDDALNRQAWRDTLPRFAKRPGALDTGRYMRFGTFLAQQGLVPSAPPLSEITIGVD